MLVLTRKVGEDICIGDNVTIRVCQIKPSRTVLSIQAPDDVTILRGELRKEDACRATTTKPDQTG